MKGTTETYHSYGNIFTSTAEVFKPKTLAELKEILGFCQKENRKITVAGTFNSFDKQNGSKDVVISLRHFDKISYDKNNHTITVGAGANWGDILDVVYQNKCALFTCITGTAPTAAGTLSVHSNSTWTPSVGKEGNHCLSFDIMLTNGKVLTCSRTENQDLFYGAISGLGILGFITQITYQVFYIGSDYQIKLATVDCNNIDNIEEKLWVRKSEKLEELNDLRSQSTLFYIDNGTPKFSIHNRSYEPTPKKIKGSKALFLGATLASGLLRVMPSLANKAIKADANRPQHKRNLTKGLEVVKEGTFWAQPDYIWTKKIGKTFSKLGYHSKMYQNSYFIPEGDNKVSVFTKRIFELIQEYQLHFFMFDILYVPKDEPFILSPSRNSGGFYVNTTFMDKTNKEDLLYCYSLLNELAFEMGGNLNLAKNCFIKPELLEKMYAANLAEMVLLKQKYDPISLITSSFFEDYFPHYFPIQKQPL